MSGALHYRIGGRYSGRAGCDGTGIEEEVKKIEVYNHSWLKEQEQSNKPRRVHARLS